MQDRYLITQSLLSSWLWLFKSDSCDEFMKSLKREPTETNEYMQKGIEFENLVYETCETGENSNHEWSEAAGKIAKIVSGGQFQYAGYKDITIGNYNFLLYGRLDCLKAGTIYDIKYTGKYDAGKYITSPQHPMYFELVPEADRFVYLVSNGYQVWQEEYKREECFNITQLIRDFVHYLESSSLIDVYLNSWKAKGG